MTRPTLTSARLELRAMTSEHLPLLEALDADPEVLRHILGRARTPAEGEVVYEVTAPEWRERRRPRPSGSSSTPR